MYDCVEGQENMVGTGQKASCARSHGCIKEGSRGKYSNMVVRLYQKELLTQGVYRKKFLTAFYSLL